MKNKWLIVLYAKNQPIVFALLTVKSAKASLAVKMIIQFFQRFMIVAAV